MTAFELTAEDLKRWDNARTVAFHIQQLLESDYTIITDDNLIVTHIKITHCRIYVETPIKTMILISNVRPWNGLHKSIEEFNEQFRGWKIVPNSAISPMPLPQPLED